MHGEIIRSCAEVGEVFDFIDEPNALHGNCVVRLAKRSDLYRCAFRYHNLQNYFSLREDLMHYSDLGYVNARRYYKGDIRFLGEAGKTEVTFNGRKVVIFK